jgi:putative hydroxymethylpyrimidine transporter CytX
MSGLLERADVLHEWGIDPVPETHRRLSALDIAVLWGDLGVGLLVLVSGALLVPALGFPAALGAILLGSVIGCALLAAGGAAGAAQGLPTMVLLRPVLGLKGSWVPSALNALQLVGWTAVELWAMSFVANLVSKQVFGFSARPLWLIVAAVVCIGLALWGPVAVTRIWMERFAAWVVVGIAVIATLLLLVDGVIAAAFSAPGTGGLGFGIAVDLVIAMPISWMPLVADYTRFARTPRAAVTGTFVGYLIANVWLYALGALLVLGPGATPSPAGIAVGVFALGGGTIAGALLLIALLVGETDEAFADIYSGALTLQNIMPDAPQRALILVIGVIGTVLAGWLTMDRYEAFLFLIGSVFIPLFGVFLADHFVVRRNRVEISDLYRGDGRYWYSGGTRFVAFVPWVAGFVVYQWIVPTGPAWWTASVASILGSPLSDRVGWLGASIPAFIVSFALALVPGLSSRRPPSAEERHP